MSNFQNVEEVIEAFPQLDAIACINEKPRYTHDCDKCVFLGVSYVPDDNKVTGEYDVYFCEQGGLNPTIIFRYGSNGDYYSGGNGYPIGKLQVPALG